MRDDSELNEVEKEAIATLTDVFCSVLLTSCGKTNFNALSLVLSSEIYILASSFDIRADIKAKEKVVDFTNRIASPIDDPDTVPKKKGWRALEME